MLKNRGDRTISKEHGTCCGTCTTRLKVETRVRVITIMVRGLRHEKDAQLKVKSALSIELSVNFESKAIQVRKPRD